VTVAECSFCTMPVLIFFYTTSSTSILSSPLPSSSRLGAPQKSKKGKRVIPPHGERDPCVFCSKQEEGSLHLELGVARYATACVVNKKNGSGKEQNRFFPTRVWTYFINFKSLEIGPDLVLVNTDVLYRWQLNRFCYSPSLFEPKANKRRG